MLCTIWYNWYKSPKSINNDCYYEARKRSLIYIMSILLQTYPLVVSELFTTKRMHASSSTFFSWKKFTILRQTCLLSSEQVIKPRDGNWTYWLHLGYELHQPAQINCTSKNLHQTLNRQIVSTSTNIGH
jgi:hypothetical protein